MALHVFLELPEPNSSCILDHLGVLLDLDIFHLRHLDTVDTLDMFGSRPPWFVLGKWSKVRYFSESPFRGMKSIIGIAEKLGGK